MGEIEFYETILDNMTDGIYILDDKGNYIFVNSAYVQLLGMPKSTLLNYNVHDFLDTKQIDVCISDIVYEKKSQVVMFQHVYDTQKYGRKTYEQMVVSTPILNGKGNVQNILAVVRPLDIVKEQYNKCLSNERGVSSILISSAGSKEDDPSVIGESAAMKSILNLVKVVSGSDVPILITGESGTGKEVIAKYIHKTSKRKKSPFIIINCAALPEALLESELFGYEKGAFTGASTTGKKGLFEEAAGGIVFLDEINSMPLNLQAKLLRTIESKTIKRIGSTKTIAVDFHLISASNENLEQLVNEKRFRLDLYYRLNVIPVNLPPLRDRRNDIEPLAKHFLMQFCAKYEKHKIFSKNTLKNIMKYNWPGNVRELKNFVERSVIITLDETIEIENVAGIMGNDYGSMNGKSDSLLQQPLLGADYEKMLADGISIEEYLADCEKEYLKFAFQKYTSTYKVAQALNTSQASIMRRKKKYDL